MMTSSIYQKSIISRTETLSWEPRHVKGASQVAHTAARPVGFSVLTVTSCPAVKQQLRELAARLGWQLLEAETLREVWAVLHSRPINIVVTDVRMPGGYWQDVLSEAESVAAPPSMVVLAQGGQIETSDLETVEIVRTPAASVELEQAIMEAARRRAPEEGYAAPLLALSAAAAR